jgi:hypothetical protein
MGAEFKTDKNTVMKTFFRTHFLLGVLVRSNRGSNKFWSNFKAEVSSDCSTSLNIFKSQLCFEIDEIMLSPPY